MPYTRARDVDALSAFGAVVALNRSIDADTARALVATKLDVVLAPAIDDAARSILSSKTQMRVVIADCSRANRRWRS
jgi:phosphoribosylaminoimidazolecarboxamide formyltransferase/IMP cyclohydrolase